MWICELLLLINWNTVDTTSDPNQLKWRNLPPHHFQTFSVAVFRENLRYCYSLGTIVVVFMVQKQWHFVIPLLLLEIFTWNSEYVFTFQRTIHTIKGDNSKCIFIYRIMPLVWLRFFYPLSSFLQPSIGTRMWCSCFLLASVTCLDLHAPPGWLSGECVRLVTWWLWVRFQVEANFLSGIFSPLTSAEACEKSSRCLWKEKLC